MNDWATGARPRTLPAAVVPVVVGTAEALHEGHAIWWRAAVALVVSLAMQIGTNYANDYSDGVRGTDDVRVGPVRLVASGLRTPVAVRRAAFASYGVAAIAGAVLAATTTWWLLAVGAACILAGWFYTGGKRPYGYAGFGELFVFLFFGLVATAGTTFVQAESISRRSLIAAVGVGLLATALLVVNNLRDIPTDTAAGKRTLAVRLGDQNTRVLYYACVVTPIVVALAVGAWPAIAALVVAVPVIRIVRSGATGRRLVPVLVKTGQVQLVYGALLAVGLALP